MGKHFLAYKIPSNYCLPRAPTGHRLRIHTCPCGLYNFVCVGTWSSKKEILDVDRHRLKVAKKLLRNSGKNTELGIYNISLRFSGGETECCPTCKTVLRGDSLPDSRPSGVLREFLDRQLEEYFTDTETDVQVIKEPELDQKSKLPNNGDRKFWTFTNTKKPISLNVNVYCGNLYRLEKWELVWSTSGKVLCVYRPYNDHWYQRCKSETSWMIFYDFTGQSIIKMHATLDRCGGYLDENTFDVTRSLSLDK